MSRVCLCLFFVVLCGAALPLSAETLVPGQRYQGKKTLEVPEVSIAFDLPSGWTGTLPPGTEWFHVGKDHQPGRVFLWVARASEPEVRATMTQGFPAGDAVLLTPTGALRKEGRALVGDYDATDGTNQYKAQARARLDGGIVVAVVAVAPPEKLAEFQKLAIQIEKSIKFNVKPKKAKASGSVGGGPWASALSNKRVVRFHHGSGYSEKTQFILCANGRFTRGFSASSNSMNGTGVAADRNGGKWSVAGNRLTLTWNDGSVSTHQLEDRNGQLFVDGNRWLRETYVCP